MRRKRMPFTALCVLALFAVSTVPACAEETLAVRDAEEQRNPYRPVRVETYTKGDTGAIHIRRVYQLTPVDDPAGIPTQDFEDHGWVYHLSEETHEEERGTDTRQITRTVTKSSDTDNTEQILKKLDAAIPVTTEDGYSGVLRLDHTSITVDAAGYATRENAVTATRVYPDLEDADLALIPKTIEENGRALTLDDVRWEEGWQTDAEGGFLRYCATATYVGATSTRYATGYTISANYTGEVSRSDVEMITYSMDFAPVREAETVEVPPRPEDHEAADSPDTDRDGVPDGKADNAAAENPHGESGEAALSNDGTAPPDGGAENESPGGAERPEYTRIAADYSGLKRTLFSGGLLIALAAAAYAVHRIRQERGGRNNL